MSTDARVSIPDDMRKTIHSLKEIVKNHSDEEIYAMLVDCAMDPNETVQRLLLQDPFHEVKRKRDKRKANNREPADARWRPASQGRVGRGGQGNYSSRNVSHDAVGEKNLGKENGIHQTTEKGFPSPSSPPSKDTESKSTIPISSSVTGLTNGPARTDKPLPAQGSTSKDSSVGATVPTKETSATVINKTTKFTERDVKNSVSLKHVSSSSSQLLSSKPASVSGLHAASDPVLVPSLDAHIPGNVGTIKCELGTKLAAAEVTGNKDVSRGVSGSEMNHPYTHDEMQGKSQVIDGNQFSDVSQVAYSLSRASSTGSRPSSNYNNRSQQVNGGQRVGPAKEWKLKSTNVKPAPLSEKPDISDAVPTTQEATTGTLPTSSSLPFDEPISKLQNRLEELQFSDTKQVIIPNHLQVPESEKTGLSFGSFDANFSLTTSFVNDTEYADGSAELSESSEEVVENVEEPTSSHQIASLSVQEADYSDPSQSPASMSENLTSSAYHSQSPTEIPENLTSREPENSSTIPTAAPEYDQSKSEAVLAQYSVVHTAPTYSNFGLVPQMIANQFATVEGAESQARDATRSPGFLVPQPFDPTTGYYTSMYRPSVADTDGRFSPFFAPAPAAKYSGNVAVLPAHAGQTPQESGNSLVLSSTGPAPLVTQAGGAMQTPITVSQQSIPVFRQPSGVHLSHYPPNYVPYTQYLPPFYIPSPSMHPFLSNTTFPQQPPTGNLYPAPGQAGVTPVKFAISQYKPPTNVSNPSHIGVPTGFVTSGSSTGSEDLASRYKENNVYITGQQSEGSVWIPTPGRDVSPMQPTSFYNIPTQAQQMAYPQIYHHPAQTVAPMLQQTQAMPGAVEMVGPASGGVYQQPQCTQINWVNNY